MNLLSVYRSDEFTLGAPVNSLYIHRQSTMDLSGEYTGFTMHLLSNQPGVRQTAFSPYLCMQQFALHASAKYSMRPNSHAGLPALCIGLSEDRRHRSTPLSAFRWPIPPSSHCIGVYASMAKYLQERPSHN